jgi:hypothetical protein
MRIIYFIIIIVLISLSLQAQDRLIFSGGYGAADVKNNEHKLYDFRVAGKNLSALIALNYSYLVYKQNIALGVVSDDVTDSYINDVNFQLGRVFSFGSYSSLTLSTGIGLIFLKQEFRQSEPAWPEVERKDFSFPLGSSLYLGLLKNLGISVHAKKSYNDIAEYFSYSIAVDIIF